jgi:hypothetical protein
MPSALWAGPGGSLERSTLEPTGDGGRRLSGTVLLTVRRDPTEIRYSIVVDEAWRTRVVGIRVDGDRRRDAVALQSDGEGRWTAGERELEAIEGCLDVDLEFTPATTIIAINRLEPPLGEEVTTDAAWVRFPGRDIGRIVQRYERIGDRTYRYRTGESEATLALREDGLIRNFGSLWREVGP